MNKKRPAATVREPVQVYLEPGDRALLDRAAEAMGTTRAEVLRRGLRRVGAEVLGEETPMRRFLREADAVSAGEAAPTDVASDPDAHLDRWERERWPGGA